MGRWSRICAGIALAGLAAGCATILGLGEPEYQAAPDGSTPDADRLDGAPANEAGDQPDPFDADLPLQSDAGVPDDDGGDPPPSPEAGACPTTGAFIPATGATGKVCNSVNALPDVPGAAGLDHYYTDTLGMIDGRPVSSCVGVTFAKPLVHFVVRASSVAMACNTTCSVSSKECGTGDTAHVFAGTAGGYTYVATIALLPAYRDYSLKVPDGGAPTQVVVCRTGNGMGRDDVNVYAIFGDCLP